VITQELLDELWDFGDPAGSERRLACEAASQAHTDAERAELLTQQARALGRQERFGAGRALLDAVVGSSEPTALWVADPNPRAQAFYRKHGFAADGTARFEDGVREIRMVRGKPS